MNPFTSIRMASRMVGAVQHGMKTLRHQDPETVYKTLVERAGDTSAMRKQLTAARKELTEKAASMNSETKAGIATVISGVKGAAAEAPKQLGETVSKVTQQAGDYSDAIGKAAQKGAAVAKETGKKLPVPAKKKCCHCAKTPAVISVLALIVGAVATAAWWLLRRTDKPGYEPPRISDEKDATRFSDATLVYSSDAPEDTPAEYLGGEEKSDSTIESLKETAAETAEAIRKTAKGLADKAADATSSVVDKVTGGDTDQLIDEAGNIAAEAKDKAADAAEDVASATSEAAEKVKETVEKATDAAKDTLHKGQKKAEDKVAQLREDNALKAENQAAVDHPNDAEAVLKEWVSDNTSTGKHALDDEPEHGKHSLESESAEEIAEQVAPDEAASPTESTRYSENRRVTSDQKKPRRNSKK